MHYVMLYDLGEVIDVKGPVNSLEAVNVACDLFGNKLHRNVSVSESNFIKENNELSLYDTKVVIFPPIPKPVYKQVRFIHHSTGPFPGNNYPSDKGKYAIVHDGHNSYLLYENMVIEDHSKSITALEINANLKNGIWKEVTPVSVYTNK